MKKKSLLLTAVTLLTLLAVALTGCAGGGQSTNANELTIAIPEEIESTDAQQIRWNNVVHDLLHEPFVNFDLEMKEIVPAFCESFEVAPDGKQITFKFSADAKFSNGNAVTAESVKAAMERYIAISPYASDYDPITQIVVQDPQTIVLKFDDPPAFIWPVFATSYSGTVDVEAATEAGDEAFSRAVVANGPYYVGEWVQGSHITLLKNPHYQTFNPDLGDNLKFEKITVRFIPEDFTRISELETGNVDIVVGVPVENVEQVKNNANLKVYEFVQTGIDYIVLNTNVAPLDNVNVRKAIAIAMNKEEMNSAYLNNTVIPKYGLISPAQLCYDEATENELKEEFAYDAAEAASLLAAAGWTEKNAEGFLVKDGKILSFEMMVPTDRPALKKAAPVIQAQLAQVGIKVELKEFESRYIKQAVTDKDFVTALRLNEWSDPDIMYHVYTGGALPWQSDEVDQLLTEARFIMDMGERTAKYSEIQKAIMEDIPVIPLFSEYHYMASGANISGMKVAPDGKAYLNDVTKE
ncbi:MAG: ABC transporter substrate-binding protein [bacterium]